MYHSLLLIKEQSHNISKYDKRIDRISKVIGNYLEVSMRKNVQNTKREKDIAKLIFGTSRLIKDEEIFDYIKTKALVYFSMGQLYKELTEEEKNTCLLAMKNMKYQELKEMYENMPKTFSTFDYSLLAAALVAFAIGSSLLVYIGKKEKRVTTSTIMLIIETAKSLKESQPTPSENEDQTTGKKTGKEERSLYYLKLMAIYLILFSLLVFTYELFRWVYMKVKRYLNEV